jgi:hypothetical protein
VVAEVRRHDPHDYIAFVLSGVEGPEPGLTFDDDDPIVTEPDLAAAAGREQRAPTRALLEPLLQILMSQDPDGLGRRRLLDLDEAVAAFGEEIPREFREMWDAVVGATRRR